MNEYNSIFLQKLGRPFFGSKSGYRISHPLSDPYFNSYILIQKNDLFIEAWRGDIDLNDNETIKNLKELQEKIQLPFLIYKESTVHNQIFNRQPFPFKSYDCKIFLFDDNVIMEKT